jgi:hypothetical protein
VVLTVNQVNDAELSHLEHKIYLFVTFLRSVVFVFVVVVVVVVQEIICGQLQAYSAMYMAQLLHLLG